MKIIGKMTGSDLIIACSQRELLRIIGKDGYISDSEAEKLFAVGATIGIVDVFDVFKQAVNSPEKLQKMAQQMHDEADHISKLAANYERVITPPVKPVK